MKILFIGGTKRGYLTLKALIENGENVTGIISLLQDEHEIDRYEAKIKNLAEEFKIPCHETKWMKDKDYREIISNEIFPDVAFVVGCRVLISEEIYTIPPLGTLAVHDSLLPEYRGFAPLNWAILNGEKESGVSLFYLNELMDGGDIVSQKKVRIEANDSAPLLYEKICDETVNAVLETCLLLKEDKTNSIPQNYYESGSFTCSRTPDDGLIDWNLTSNAIHNKVRALTYPYPGAFTYLNFQRLTIWESELINNPPFYKGRIPGRVVNISPSKGFVDVLSGDSILRINTVQLEGQDKASAASVIKSLKISLGLKTSDLLSYILTLENKIQGIQRYER